MDTKTLNALLSRERAKLLRQEQALEATRAAILIYEREIAKDQPKK